MSVTLTDTAGDTATGTASGGQSPAVVNVDASHLSEGIITSFATVTDEVGNSARLDGESTTMDVTPPDAPTDVHGPPGEVVNGDEAASVPVTVHVADPSSIARLHVQLTAGDQTADATGPVMGFATTINVDASKLPDGQIGISAWTVDAAGNSSTPSTAARSPRIRRHPTTRPASAWRGATRTPTATLTRPRLARSRSSSGSRRPPTRRIASSSRWAGNASLDGGDYRYVVGPLDLSDRPDGPLPLGVTVTDPAGNSTSTDSAIKDTVAPEAPTSFTVPEIDDGRAS